MDTIKIKIIIIIIIITQQYSKTWFSKLETFKDDEAFPSNIHGMRGAPETSHSIY